MPAYACLQLCAGTVLGTERTKWLSRRARLGRTFQATRQSNGQKETTVSGATQGISTAEAKHTASGDTEGYGGGLQAGENLDMIGR